MNRKKRPRKWLRRRCGGRTNFAAKLQRDCSDAIERHNLATQPFLIMKKHEAAPIPGGSALFQRMFTRLGCNGRPPRFRVEFYPYSSLILTIRRREEVIYVRFSDLLRRARLSVLEAAAALLLSRVYRRKAPRALVEPYLEYARSDRTRSRISRMRRGRVRLASAGPRGRRFA